CCKAADWRAILPVFAFRILPAHRRPRIDNKFNMEQYDHIADGRGDRRTRLARLYTRLNKRRWTMRKTARWIMALALTVAAAVPAIASDRSSPMVEKIKARGVLHCPGHNGSNPGFMEVDAQGNWRGFDIDICRAVATAIVGSPDAVKIVPMSFAQRWTSLASGEVDLIIKTTDATM